MFYDYSADELRLDRQTAERVRVQQLANFTSGQPWGVFLLETATPKLYGGQLRRASRATCSLRKPRLQFHCSEYPIAGKPTRFLKPRRSLRDPQAWET